MFHAEIIENECQGESDHNNDCVFSVYKVWVLIAGFFWEINTKTLCAMQFGLLHHTRSLPVFHTGHKSHRAQCGVSHQ